MVPIRSKAGSPRRGWFLVALTIVALACISSAPAWSQTWTGATNNLWFTGTNWNGGVPNSSSADVTINNATNNPVELNGSASVGDLTLGASNSLSFNLGTEMFLSGPTISNAGAITINAGSGSNAILQLQASTTLSGGGTLTLNSGDNNGSVYIQQGVGGVTLSNVDNTIQGYGVIGNGGISLDNESAGKIDANSSGMTLTLNGGGITNAGLMEATGGGILHVSGQTINNTGGNITANGGTVSLSNVTVVGGTLNTLNGGTLGATGSTVLLDGLSSGALTISSGSTWSGGLGSITEVQGSIVNNGAISLVAGSGSNSILDLTNNVTLSGGGTVTMNSGNNSGQVYIQQALGGLTLTNVDNTIQGYGVIGNGGIALVNEASGTINANSSGNTLILDGSGGITNQGLLEATGGGILNLNAVTVNNFGSNITANGGNVLIQNSTIEGGTLNSLGGGSIGQGSGTSVTLDGTTQGAITISSGTTWNTGLGSITYTKGSIVNDGAISLLAGSGNNAILNLSTSTTLSGGGTVTMNSGNNAGHVYIQQNEGGLTLTNADNTIQGYGVIGNGGITVVNQALGTIDANVSGQTLLLNGSGLVTNQGTLEATNGGILNLDGITVNNSASSITANAGSVVINGGTVIEGGALTSLNGGTIGQGNVTTVTLDGSTAGALTISSGTTWNTGLGSITYTKGSIVNDGAISLTAGSANDAILNLSTSTTLSGGGTVTMNSGDNNGHVYIQQNEGGLTLTNVDNTIQGYGVIGNGGITVVNQALGTIDANVSGQTLLLNASGGVTNQGTLEATNGGILNINAITVNDAGSGITANGGNVLINGGSTIDGGFLTNLGGGTIGDGAGTAFLNGSTASGAVTITTGSTWTGGLGSETYTLGSIVNNGNIQLNGGSGDDTFLNLVSNTTLSGGGTVTLNSSSGSGAAYIVQNSGGLTLTNVNNTIQGYGVIGNGGLTVVNDALGTINANVTNQTLTLNSSGGVTNLGLLEGTNGGTLNISAITVNNAGGNITANGGTVLINAGAIIDGGALNSLNGGTLGNGGGSAILNGTTAAGAVTISSGSTWTGGLGSTTYTTGSIVNNGNIQLNGGSGNNTFLNLLGNTTLSGGGTVTLNSSTGTGAAYIQQNSGGLTLTNTDNTIQGYGVIGNGGLAVVNGANGTILANSVGNDLVVNGSGGLTNNGTLQANAGSTLVVSSNLTNFSGTTLTGGTYNANGGTIQLNLPPNTSGGEIVTDAGNIILNGVSAAINDIGNHNALSDLATIAPSNGSLSLLSGAQLTTSAANFANNGTLTIGSGSVLNVSSGNFAQGATGTLNEQVAGTGAGQFGVTNVSGTATLAAGSTLDVDFLNTFNAGTGDDYILTFLDATGGLTGTYSNVDLNCPVGDTCSLGYTADTAYLGIDGPAAPPPPPPPPPPPGNVIPEPGTFPLLLTGLAGIVAGIKARNRRVSLKK